jgi:uncharacterized protein DUF6318
MPAGAKGTSAASAKAFAKYYVELINHASMSGETVDLRAASTKKCSACEAIANEVERQYKNGGHLEGGSWTPGLASVGLSSRKTSALVSFPVRIAKQIEYAPTGKPAKTIPSATGTLDLRLIRLSGAWLVDRLDARQS